MATVEANFYLRSPIWSFLLPGALLFVLWLVAPIDFDYAGNACSLVLGVCLPAVFVLGLLAGCRRSGLAIVSFQLSTERVRRSVHLLSLIGFFGLALRLAERIFARGGGAVGSDFVENRELLEAGGNGAMALVGGVLVTALFLLPLYTLLLRRLGEGSWRYTLLWLLSLLYPISDVLLQGSRSTFVIYVGVCLVAALSLYPIRRLAKYLLLIGLAMISLVWAAAVVFATRAEQMGIDPIVSTYLSGYAYFAPASSDILSYLDTNGYGGVGGLVFAFLHFCQYALHGIYEFFYVAANIDVPTTFGLYSFYIPAKIIFTLVDGPSIEGVINNGVLRPGVYTTLFGPWVYDFGIYGSVLVSFFAGFGAGTLSRLLRRGHLVVLPLYASIYGFLPFAFVANLYSSGTGQYFIINTFFLSILFVFRFFNLRVLEDNNAEVV